MIRTHMKNFRKLFTDAPALVAAIGGERVFRTVAPQTETPPYVTYFKTGTTNTESLRGVTGKLVRYQIRVAYWAPDGDAADDLGEIMRDRIDGLGLVTGAAAGVAVGEDIIYRCKLKEERDEYASPVSGQEFGDCVSIQDWEVWFGEVVPTLGE